MPAVTAERSLGASLGFGDAQGGPYTTIARVRDFRVPGITASLFDVTAHDNTTGFKEWVASLLKDIDELTFDISYIHTEASHNITTGLRYLNYNVVKKDWQITLNTEMGSGTVQSAGYVTKFDGPQLPVDGVSIASVTIKFTDYFTVTE